MIDKKYLKEIYAIHPKLFSKIRKAGTKTGSKVFGGWEEGHDIDFIMPPGFEPSFNEAFDNHLIIDGDSKEENDLKIESGYMKTDNGTVINLLYAQTEEEYRIWTTATAILKELVEAHPTIAENMKDKQDRIQFFEILKEILR